MQPVLHPFALRDALVGQVLRGSAGVSYYLREAIGEGGQGWVFKANWDEPSGLVVIVKVLRPDVVHRESLARFQREAEVLRLLSQQPRPNPHIVRFYDHAIAHYVQPGTNEGYALPFTVLEYVHGPTLEQALLPMRGRGLPVERVRRLVRQVVHALQLVHEQKVVHRDLKPSNILLATEQGVEIAKVTDFGLVKRVDMNLQRTTTLAGASLGYAPPEQYEQGNQRVTPRTDIFSLAAIAYEMLTGSQAFPFSDHDNPLLIIARILTDPRPTLVRVQSQLAPELRERPDLTERIDAVFARALRADPQERHASVVEFWQQLEPILQAIGARPSAPPPSKLPFANTDLARTRPSIGTPEPVAPGSALPGALSAAHVRVNAGGVPSHPSGTRVRPIEHASNPAAWTWRIVTQPIRAGLVRDAVFAPAGELLVGTGPTALARWERGTWASLALPPTIDPRLVRGASFLPNGDLLVYGASSLAARLGQRGGAEVWTLPDRETTFLASHTDANDTTTLVGERAAKAPGDAASESMGCVVQLAGNKVAFAADAPACHRLNGVTRLVGGPLVACGDWGVIVRIGGSGVEQTGVVCGGHLLAIAALDDGSAVTVGAGGHALHVSARLEASLEAVQTTRDLAALAIGADGVAWAGAAQARLVRRETDRWIRMNGELGISPGIVAIWASDRVVRAACDDGAVIEGRLA